MLTRILSIDDAPTIITKMAEGNLGAANALVEIFTYPHSPIQQCYAINVIHLLDKLNIYGTDIYVLYSDICKKDIYKMIACVLAVDYNEVDANILKDACHRQDYSGRDLIPVDQLYTTMQLKCVNLTD